MLLSRAGRRNHQEEGFPRNEYFHQEEGAAAEDPGARSEEDGEDGEADDVADEDKNDGARPIDVTAPSHVSEDDNPAAETDEVNPGDPDRPDPITSSSFSDPSEAEDDQNVPMTTSSKWENREKNEKNPTHTSLESSEPEPREPLSARALHLLQQWINSQFGKLSLTSGRKKKLQKPKSTIFWRGGTADMMRQAKQRRQRKIDLFRQRQRKIEGNEENQPVSPEDQSSTPGLSDTPTSSGPAESQSALLPEQAAPPETSSNNFDHGKNRPVTANLIHSIDFSHVLATHGLLAPVQCVLLAAVLFLVLRFGRRVSRALFKEERERREPMKTARGMAPLDTARSVEEEEFVNTYEVVKEVEAEWWYSLWGADRSVGAEPEAEPVTVLS